MDSNGLKEAHIRWVHSGATWRIPLNRLSAAAIRPVVKLLWPLVIVMKAESFQSAPLRNELLSGNTRISRPIAIPGPPKSSVMTDDAVVVCYDKVYLTCAETLAESKLNLAHGTKNRISQQST